VTAFYVTGQAHSIVGGSAWEPTLWRAVQRAAWEALTRESVEAPQSSLSNSDGATTRTRGGAVLWRRTVRASLKSVVKK